MLITLPVYGYFYKNDIPWSVANVAASHSFKTQNYQSLNSHDFLLKRHNILKGFDSVLIVFELYIKDNLRHKSLANTSSRFCVCEFFEEHLYLITRQTFIIKHGIRCFWIISFPCKTIYKKNNEKIRKQPPT